MADIQPAPEDHPQEGQPQEGQPQEGQPQEGQPQEGQPQENNPGFIRSSDEHPEGSPAANEQEVESGNGGSTIVPHTEESESEVEPYDKNDPAPLVESGADTGETQPEGVNELREELGEGQAVLLNNPHTNPAY